MLENSHGRLQPDLVTLSVVSHGQGNLIRKLLGDLRSITGFSFDIVLTINIPEDEDFISEFPDLPIRIIRNISSKGFGANHNAAFRVSHGDFFIVLNPDIRIGEFSIFPLLEVLKDRQVGVCVPVVLSTEGEVEDSVRRYPTLRILAQRVVLRRRSPDYVWGKDPIVVDWAAGMFLLFPRDSFMLVKGFDERFFMYCEDVDICRRLKKAGLKTVLQPTTSVIHAAQRASRRSFKHIRWHVVSLLRFLSSR